MPTLTLSDVAVRRGRGLVVEGLTLRLHPGSVFWVVGPNGAGKSSLLRVMAGLDAPAAGAVTRAQETAPFRYFHPEMALPGWSVVGAWDRLVRRLEPGARAPTPLRPAVGPGRWVRRLSTGERKRLLLDTLFRVPGSLLLDEPYAHLSPDAKVALSELLRRRAESAVVVVATNQAAHRAPGEPGLRLEAGRADQLGASREPSDTVRRGPVP